MTDYKFLSRKFVLSVLLFIVATYFLKVNIINQFQWQIVLMATAMTYIGGRSFVKAKIISEKSVLFFDRIKGIFSREFLVALGVFVLVTFFAITKKVNGDVWFQVSTVIGSAYNVFNSLAATK